MPLAGVASRYLNDNQYNESSTTNQEKFQLISLDSSANVTSTTNMNFETWQITWSSYNDGTNADMQSSLFNDKSNLNNLQLDEISDANTTNMYTNQYIPL